jgi:hypothetical protein
MKIMCSSHAINLCVFVAQAAAKELVASYIGSAQNYTDASADQLLDRLFGRPLQERPTGRRDLEATTLGKASFRTLGSHAPLAAIQPRIVPISGRSAMGARVSSIYSRRPADIPTTELGLQGQERLWGADGSVSLGRREALAVGTVLGIGLANGERPAIAGDDTVTFYGTAFPPASYKPYNADNPPKDSAVYEFDFPAEWEIDQPTKVDKGTKGIDCRVFNPKDRKGNEVAYVVVLSRAGEDNQRFEEEATERTFSSLAGSETKLSDAFSSADSLTSSKRTVKGKTFVDFDLRSPATNYLASFTSDQGKLFALVIRSTPAQTRKDEASLKAMLASFRLTGRDVR